MAGSVRNDIMLSLTKPQNCTLRCVVFFFPWQIEVQSSYYFLSQLSLAVSQSSFCSAFLKMWITSHPTASWSILCEKKVDLQTQKRGQTHGPLQIVLSQLWKCCLVDPPPCQPIKGLTSRNSSSKFSRDYVDFREAPAKMKAWCCQRGIYTYICIYECAGWILPAAGLGHPVWPVAALKSQSP